MPFSPIYFLLFLLLLIGLVAVAQFGLIQLTISKLGLSPHSAFVLLLSSLIGSGINLPLFTVRSASPQPPVEPFFHGLLRSALPGKPGYTIIAVNLGGCLIPLTLCYYLFAHTPLSWAQTLLATAVVAGVSYAMSRPISGLGVGMPPFVAPVTAALVSISISSEHCAPLAYISGVLGVLIGADILRLGDIKKMGPPVASIGGAGTFDGIFLTGILAVLLT
ncbi:MAG: DUF1614 domain-containing protein [Gammaproteobacteria bacterium]